MICFNPSLQEVYFMFLYLSKQFKPGNDTSRLGIIGDFNSIKPVFLFTITNS